MNVLLNNSMAILPHQHKPAWKSIGILTTWFFFFFFLTSTIYSSFFHLPLNLVLL